MQAGRVPREAAHDEEAQQLPPLPRRRAPRGQGWSLFFPTSSNSVISLGFGLFGWWSSFRVFVIQYGIFYPVELYTAWLYSLLGLEG